MGAGKTYLGVKLVQAILANTPQGEKSPLLILTYTNHALDQFLEGLIKVGITKLVRMGSRSKSETIQVLTLHLPDIVPSDMAEMSERLCCHCTKC